MRNIKLIVIFILFTCQNIIAQTSYEYIDDKDSVRLMELRQESEKLLRLQDSLTKEIIEFIEYSKTKSNDTHTEGISLFKDIKNERAMEYMLDNFFLFLDQSSPQTFEECCFPYLNVLSYNFDFPHELLKYTEKRELNEDQSWFIGYYFDSIIGRESTKEFFNRKLSEKKWNRALRKNYESILTNFD